MNSDPTENVRRQMVPQINANASPERSILEAKVGQVWDTSQLQQDFEVLGFMAPFVVVSRKADGLKGSLEFQHAPRYYYNFVPDSR